MHSTVQSSAATYRPQQITSRGSNRKLTAVSKALLVFQAIIKDGPTTPQAIADATGLPRLTVYRAIAEIRAQGWVRDRLGDNAIQISSQLDDLFSEVNIQLKYAEILADCAREVCKHRRLHCDIGIISRPGKAEILESTDREQSAPYLAEDLLSSFSIAALSTMDDGFVERHLERLQNAPAVSAVSNEEVEQARKAVAEARSQEFMVASTAEFAIARGFRLGKSDGYAVRLRPRSSHSVRMEALKDVMGALTQCIKSSTEARVIL